MRSQRAHLPPGLRRRLLPAAHPPQRPILRVPQLLTNPISQHRLVPGYVLHFVQPVVHGGLDHGASDRDADLAHVRQVRQEPAERVAQDWRARGGGLGRGDEERRGDAAAAAEDAAEADACAALVLLPAVVVVRTYRETPQSCCIRLAEVSGNLTVASRTNRFQTSFHCIRRVERGCPWPRAPGRRST
jgi:hypothetical protein